MVSRSDLAIIITYSRRHRALQITDDGGFDYAKLIRCVRMGSLRRLRVVYCSVNFMHQLYAGIPKNRQVFPSSDRPLNELSI